LRNHKKREVLQLFRVIFGVLMVLLLVSISGYAASQPAPGVLPAPSGLKWDIITSSYVDVSWNAVGSATFYKIYRAEEGSKVFEDITPVENNPFVTQPWQWLTTTFRDPAVTPGKSYSYKVAAGNALGESAQSEALRVLVTNYPATYKFDFGTEESPVADGYLKVTEKTAYEPALGYGFTETARVTSGYRSNTNSSFGDVKLEGDFCLPKTVMEEYRFQVDLPNGLYGIKVIAGDSATGVPNRTDLEVEGVFIGTVNAGRGQITDKTFAVPVTDGQMNLTFKLNGRVNALEITPIIPQPTGLTVADLTKTSVKLAWNPVNGAAGYQIYRASVTNSGYVKIGVSNTGAFVDKTVLPGAAYFYRVAADTPNGESPKSNAVKALPADGAVMVPATPGNLAVSKVTASTVSLSWKAVKGAARYHIYRATEANGLYTYLGVSDKAKLSYVDPAVSTCVKYYYRVTGVNAGGESALSSAASSSIKAVPGIPAGVTVSAPTATSVSLTWRPVLGADSYRVYRSNFGYNNYQVAGNLKETSFTDNQLAKGASYTYKIAAVNVAGESSKSTEVLAMTQTDVNLIKTIDITAAGAGSRMRLGDLNGDGRVEMLLVQPDFMGPEVADGKLTGKTWNDGYVPHGVQCLTAFDLDGKMLWQVGTPDPDVKGSGSDEPAQIYDLDGDGINEVVFVKTETVTEMVPDPKDATKKVRGIVSKTDKLMILDGRTGTLKRQYDLPESEPVGDPRIDIDKYRLHDAILFANLSGRKNAQEIILKDRYHNLAAFDINFNFLWKFTNSVGHYPWPYDINGDGREEIMVNYNLLNQKGETLWAAQDVSDHVDCLWFGDVDPKVNGMEVVLGGSCTVMYDRNGNEVWRNNDQIEPQQVLLGKFRMDLPGLQVAGLDRVSRGWDSFYAPYLPGRDSLFLVSGSGATLAKEIPDDSGYGTAIKISRNWTGTHVPLIFAFKRGSVNGVPILPRLHDGFMNPIAEFPVDGNVMLADLGGDSKEEVLVYTATTAYIYANGPCDLASSIIGVQLPQNKENYNYSRYFSGQTGTIATRIPAGLAATVDKNGVVLTWTPVLGATGYRIYRAESPNGEYKLTGKSDAAAFTDKGGKKDTVVYYKVTAVDAEGESGKSVAVEVK
jgi:fibronectin type 3 domain-containing protein